MLWQTWVLNVQLWELLKVDLFPPPLLCIKHDDDKELKSHAWKRHTTVWFTILLSSCVIVNMHEPQIIIYPDPLITSAHTKLGIVIGFSRWPKLILFYLICDVCIMLWYKGVSSPNYSRMVAFFTCLRLVSSTESSYESTNNLLLDTLDDKHHASLWLSSWTSSLMHILVMVHLKCTITLMFITVSI